MASSAGGISSGAEPSEADLRYELALDEGCAVYVRVLPG
jgi:hypothetical protein